MSGRHGSSIYGLQMVPAVAGLALILLALLIYIHPAILAYAVATVFLLCGAALLALAWRLRARVEVRRLDETDIEL